MPKVLVTSKGVYAVLDGKTFECPVGEEFELDEKQANKIKACGKLKFVTNKGTGGGNKAAEVVAKIQSATSEDELEQFMDDDRKSVQDALDAKLEELKQAE